MSRIAIVEDDLYLREELAELFRAAGHEALVMQSFIEIGEELLSLAPDLLILDVNLPVQNGYVLCKWLKARASFPILILTSRDLLKDELTALELGADDFVTKPCHPDRLLARSERLLQLYRKLGEKLEVQGFVLDTESFLLSVGKEIVQLSESEGLLLKELLLGFPQAVSKEELLAKVWSEQASFDDNLLQVNVARLRKKLAQVGQERAILTDRGFGYRLREETHEG